MKIMKLGISTPVRLSLLITTDVVDIIQYFASLCETEKDLI